MPLTPYFGSVLVTWEKLALNAPAPTVRGLAVSRRKCIHFASVERRSDWLESAAGAGCSIICGSGLGCCCDQPADAANREMANTACAEYRTLKNMELGYLPAEAPRLV